MEMRNEAEHRIKKILQYTAVFIGFLTPYAYLIGLCYYQGNLRAFGVSADNFPLSTADVYVNAYIAMGLILLDIFKYLEQILKNPWTYALLFGLVIFVFLLIKFSKRSRESNRDSKLSVLCRKVWVFFHHKNNDLAKSFSFVMIPAYLLSLAIYIFSIIVIFWWGLPLWADNQGKNVGKQEIQRYLQNGCTVDKKTNWNKCVVVEDESGNLLYEGLWIAKKDNELAIFRNDGSYLIKLHDKWVIRKAFN
jgi:hypothetical protein